MPEKDFKLYPYRWIVLAVFMFINLTIQILWISFSPITGQAAVFYKVTDGAIIFLGMTFMIAFIPLSIPVSWAIDTYGFRKTVSLGAILMSVFGILRGITGDNYTWVLISTIGIAIAQPFLLNAWTKVPAQWFSVNERATAVGLITLSNLAGTALGFLLPPELIKVMPIPTVQLIFGVFAAFSTVLFILLAKEKPATPPCPAGQEVRSLMLDGLKHAFKVKDFWLYLFVIFIGMGIFNGINLLIEPIVRGRGFSAQAGTMGALMVVGGVLGAVLIPPFSDKSRKRKIFLLLGFILSIPGLIGLTFAASAWWLYVSAFALGFFIVSASPVGMQYAAEITQPTPEGTSNGIIQLFGQASAFLVYLMQIMKGADNSLTPAMLFSLGLVVVSVILILNLKDPVIKSNQ